MAGHSPYSWVWIMRMGSAVAPRGMDWAETFAKDRLANSVVPCGEVAQKR